MRSRGAIRLRAMRAVDVPAVEALVAAAFAPAASRIGRAPAPVLTDWAAVVYNDAALLATVDDAPAGVLVRWPHPDHVLVETVAVAPALQGTGIGALLLDVAERESIEAGVNAVRLCTNAAMTEALAWYPRRGYAVTGRRTEAGFDRVFFERLL